MSQLSYKLEVFEGPLDLLLNLISKNKLNIYDIPVSELLDQYMEQIGRMREANVDIASEFLTMASRLLYIKTATLMPKHEEVEELKKELVGELMEYQLCRDMAQKLGELADFDGFSREEMKLDVDKTYRLQHDVSILYDAYIAAAGRSRQQPETSTEVFEDIVAKPIVSVTTRVIHILKLLYKTPTVSLQRLFEQSTSKSEAVATFLAVLDLLKAERIYLDDEGCITFTQQRVRNSEG